MTQLRVEAITHQGRVRARNEDTIAVGAWLCSETMGAPLTTICDLHGGVPILVCDGMGGHAAGAHASQLAAQTLAAALRGPMTEGDISYAIHSANRAVFDAANESERRGMGTTVAGLYCRPERLIWFNVGDSPIFRIRDGFIRKISIDDKAPGSAHSVTQSLGGLAEFADVEPHLGEEPIQVGWRYLICSDGLTDMVPVEAIEQILADYPAQAIERLFETALLGGGADNISIIIATLEERNEPAGGNHV